MGNSEGRLRLLGYLFAASILVSSGFLVMNFVDYIGLLNSMKMVEFSIDEMLLRPVGDDTQIVITFTVVNPTSYTRLKFSSLQCQLYLITDGDEGYIGVTAYAPPVDVPLRPNEERSYAATLTVSRSLSPYFSDESMESGLSWRVRCVIHFWTPIRKYYQTLMFYPTSSVSN